MRKLILVGAVILPVLLLAAQDVPPLARTLSFETEHPGGVPAGWSVNPPGSATVDGTNVRGGRWSARLDRTETTAGAFTGITTSVPLDVSGKTIELRAFLRTENVIGFVALWLRIDGESPNLGFATTQHQQVKGTNDWQAHSVSLPVRPEGRRLVLGVLVSGTGTAWVDDVELLVDGAPIWTAPKVERIQTVLDTDREFDAGSRITIDALSPVQIDNLVSLGKVWGFLKYHHPAVVGGTRQWDYELFRVLPGVLAATDRDAGNTALANWVERLGPVAACTSCAALTTDTMHLSPDFAWIDDDTRLGSTLSRQLRAIHANRPASGQQFYVSLAPAVGNPVFDRELAYQSLRLPDAGFQLLAVYRFWNIVEYWFPYRDVIGDDWDGALRSAIPRVATAKTALEYEQQMMVLIAGIHDTHANLWSSLDARPPVGPCRLAVTVRFVEGQPIVTDPSAPFLKGDVLTSLDEVPVTTLVERWSPYYAASNEPTRLRDIARFMTRGSCGETSVGVTRKNERLTLTATRGAVPAAPGGAPTHDLPGETFRKLSDDVAYLKLSTIKGPDVAGYLAAAAGTKGLVIDIRNYPSAFVVFSLGQHLVGEAAPFARFTIGDVRNPGAFHWGPTTTLVPRAPRYTGTVVVLVDEVSQSQAEYTAMAFRAAGARIVGSTTAGADGNVSPIPLPGALRSMISGIGVFYPDKRPTQRIGIVPDVEVTPTIAGIIAGRDEVLDAGIREIVGR